MRFYVCGYRHCKNSGLIVTVLRPSYKNESASSSYVFDQFWTEDLDIVRSAASEGTPLLGFVNYRNGFGFLRVTALALDDPDEMGLPPDCIPAIFRR